MAGRRFTSAIRQREDAGRSSLLQAGTASAPCTGMAERTFDPVLAPPQCQPSTLGVNLTDNELQHRRQARCIDSCSTAAMVYPRQDGTLRLAYIRAPEAPPDRRGGLAALRRRRAATVGARQRAYARARGTATRIPGAGHRHGAWRAGATRRGPGRPGRLRPGHGYFGRHAGLRQGAGGRRVRDEPDPPRDRRRDPRRRPGASVRRRAVPLGPHIF